MKRSTSKSLRLGAAGIAILAASQLDATAGRAQTPPPSPPPAALAPAEAPAPAAPTSPLTAPSYAGPLTQNPEPIHADLAGLGTVYLTGALSGLALFQSDPYGAVFNPSGKLLGSDINNNVDLSNGMAIIQKIDGLVQFYAQVGAYSLPALGTNYHQTQRAGQAQSYFFGPLPEAYLKIVPTDTFSVSGGNLPSLIGDEYTFTFQNMNIERGLLWNLEPAISRGVQANLTTGPVAWAMSVNDGFYSSNISWISGSAAWTINPQNTLAVAAGGNFDGNTKTNSVAAPYVLNNETIVNLIYTYNAAPFTISPYFQFTNNGHNATITGATKDAQTWGGAILANYNIDDNWNLAGRAEYVSSSGNLTDGSANPLGFGPGSSAWSFTLTPTWQNGIYFARLEGSYVGVSSAAPGAAFGKSGNSKSQERLVIETGILF
ncbi:MAG TPA: outer membrane beta-barrel protein [Stellaceae bacterium]|nr:outer membrane beta-barrel protein [Stellaceae bacterium]